MVKGPAGMRPIEAMSVSAKWGSGLTTAPSAFGANVGKAAICGNRTKRMKRVLSGIELSRRASGLLLWVRTTDKQYGSLPASRILGSILRTRNRIDGGAGGNVCISRDHSRNALRCVDHATEHRAADPVRVSSERPADQGLLRDMEKSLQGSEDPEPDRARFSTDGGAQPGTGRRAPIGRQATDRPQDRCRLQPLRDRERSGSLGGIEEARHVARTGREGGHGIEKFHSSFTALRVYPDGSES